MAPGWFDVLGAPLIEGRDFADGDSISAPLVAIVNQTLARRLFGGGPAEHEMVHAFQVQSPGENDPASTAPDPTTSLQLLDYTFQPSSPLTSGRNVICVKNAGVEPHHVLLFRLVPGRSVDAFRTWFQGVQGQAPDSAFFRSLADIVTFTAGVSAIDAGGEAYFEVDLSPGEYVLVCFVAGQDEVPHVAKGMIHHFRIT